MEPYRDRWAKTWIWLALLVPAAAWAQEGGTSLETLPLLDLRAFRPTTPNWQAAGDVFAPRDGGALAVSAGTGVLVNRPVEGQHDHLFTTWEHADLELELDVMMPKGSNAGVYLMGRYEVQLFDSWGKANPTYADLGGIYERWDEGRPDGQEGYEGIAPRLNAARAPGLWQHLALRFEAPRFDADGRKVASARFVRVAVNGVVVHEDVEVTGPTRAAAFEDERPAGPLMIQGDHGPVAFRNIRYKRFGPARVQLSDVRYRLFPGAYASWPDPGGRTPAREGPLGGFRHDVSDLDTFAASFEGRLHVPTAGSYRFALDLGWVSLDPHFTEAPMGGGELRVRDRVVLRHDGKVPRAEGRVELPAGSHPFSLFYYKNWGERSTLVRLEAEGPDTPPHLLNAPGTLPEPARPAEIAVPVGGEPYVLRHMAWHGGRKRTHAVSVGDPSGVHYAMDLDQGALLYAWRGPFVDATPMWHSRGTDQLALPLGSVVPLDGAPSLAALPGTQAPWPAAVAEAAYAFSGYDLDAAGRPTFRYRVGAAEVTDHLAPGEGGLVRTLSVAGAAGLWLRLAEGRQVEALPDGGYAVDDRRYYLQLLDAGVRPVLREAAGRQELLLPLSGRTAQVRYAVVW